MFRKLLACAVALCLIPLAALAEPLETDVPIDIDCKAALLMEPMSGQVIFEWNADDPLPVAQARLTAEIIEADGYAART